MTPTTIAAQFPETADIETSSDDYARRFAGKVGAWFLEVQAQATLRMLAPYPGATILDVGGGHGQITGALVQHGYQVTVLGSDPVCQARIRPFVEQRDVEFDVGDVLNLPYADQAFDVVISYRLLPHVERWQEFLAELCRVARHAVILDYPEVRSINYVAPFLFKVKKQVEGNTRPFTCYQRSELRRFFQSQGFTDQAAFAEFFVPMVIHRALKMPRLSAAVEALFRLTGLTNVLGSPVILQLTRNPR